MFTSSILLVQIAYTALNIFRELVDCSSHRTVILTFF